MILQIAKNTSFFAVFKVSVKCRQIYKLGGQNSHIPAKSKQ